ncbi:MAG: YaiO family outer membrane beta-barrel protein [Gammaproteobacteria bacterium]
MGQPAACVLVAACAACLAAPAIACEEALRALAAAEPANTDARYDLARSCARAGRSAEALAEYEALLTVAPDNPDWLLGRSQSLMALGRPREALAPLDRARAVSPQYEDVWRANVAALEAAGDPDRALALAREAEHAFPQSSWPRDRQATIARARLLERGTRVSLAASYEDLSGGRPSWQAATLAFDHPLTGTRRLLAGVHVEERFDTQDEQFSIALVDRIGRNWSWGLSLDGAADAEILPEWNLVAELGRMLPGGRSIGLCLRHASYAAVDVDSLAATFEQYFALIRLAYTLTASRPEDISTSLGHTLRFAHDYQDGSHLTLALGYGEEAETIAPGVVQVTRNKSVSVNGVHWRSAAWGFSWEAGWYEQGDLYDRLRFRLGLEHRF